VSKRLVKNSEARRMARQVVRCVLTRLSLGFDPQKTYSGAQVQEILIGAMLTIDEQSEPMKALPGELQ